VGGSFGRKSKRNQTELHTGDRSPNSSQANSMGVGDWGGRAQIRPGEDMICFAAILNPISHPRPAAYQTWDISPRLWNRRNSGRTHAATSPTSSGSGRKKRGSEHTRNKTNKHAGIRRREENPPPVSLTARRARGGGSPPRCRPASGSHQPRHGRTG
jgi:hypothetical protein